MALRRLIGLLVLLVVLALPSTAAATDFSVTTTHDELDPGACFPGDPDCSLREAVEAANAAGTADKIAVPAGHYVLSLAPAGDDDNAGGDLDVAANGTLTLVGAGARVTSIDGNHHDRVIDVHAHATLDLARTTVTGGDNGGFGGGINVSGNSGALTSATVTDSTVSGNHSDQGGGFEVSVNSKLTLLRTTVSNNTADTTGGGLQIVPVAIGGATLNAIDSTISGNHQTPNTGSGDGGGGIADINGGVTTLNHVTMTGNTATGAGGAILRYSSSFTSKNSIVSGNRSSAAETANCDAPVVSSGNNLENGTTCGFTGETDLHGDPKLGALANNGGPTDTNALLTGSAAIDKADPSDCAGVDQRGILLPQGPACDIGAFERELTNLALTLTHSPDPVQNQGALTYTIKVQNPSLAPSRGVVVSATIPGVAALTSVKASQGSCTASATTNTTVTCSLGTLGVGATGTVTIALKPTRIGTLSTSATVSSVSFDPNLANNSATTTTKVTAIPGRCANPQTGTLGNDVLTGTKFGDKLAGKGGNDKLKGKSGDDCLSGGSGKDKLDGGKGKDQLKGGSGKDKLKGGKGKDSLDGGKGNDTLQAVDGSKDKVNCGKGKHDRAVVDGFDRVKHCETVVVRG